MVTSVDGTRLAVYRLGQGPAAVFLHGSNGGLDSWAGVAELLAPHYRCWLVARRGYHPSDALAQVKTFAREVADVWALVRAAHQESGAPVHLVGASYGAILALHAADGADGLADADDAQVALIGSLALFEPPLFATGAALRPVLRRYRDLVASGDISAAALLFARDVAQAPPQILAALSASTPTPADSADERRGAIGTLHDLEALAEDTLDPRRWGHLTVPVLLLQGADTWEPMPSTMRALAAALGDPERVIWPGQTHFATATAPALVADTLRGFFTRH
jgi:pimeloyl-ACP methyl ester carboxylesterase